MAFNLLTKFANILHLLFEDVLIPFLSEADREQGRVQFP